MHNPALSRVFLDRKIPFLYNYDTMKPIQFTLPPVKQRHHRALFDEDLPFRGRVERPKTQYNRKVKHRNRQEQE